MHIILQNLKKCLFEFGVRFARKQLLKLLNILKAKLLREITIRNINNRQPLSFFTISVWHQ